MGFIYKFDPSSPKRIDLPYCLYHILSRTITGEKAFWDGRDRNKFLKYLAQYADLFSCKIHAWCLMQRLGQIKKPGSLSWIAHNKRERFVEEKEEQNADEIVRIVPKTYIVQLSWFSVKWTNGISI